MTLIKKAGIDNDLPAQRRGIILPFRPAIQRSSDETSTRADGVSVSTAPPVAGSIVKKPQE